MEATQTGGVKRPHNQGQTACPQCSNGTKVSTYHIMADECHCQVQIALWRAKRDRAPGLVLLRCPTAHEWPGRGGATILTPPK